MVNRTDAATNSGVSGAMQYHEVHIPVRCPQCGVVSLVSFPEMVAATALTSWYQMCLHSHCHRTDWDASALEIHTMRTYLGDHWLETHRRTPTWGSVRNA